MIYVSGYNRKTLKERERRRNMPLIFVDGDPLLTQCQWLAIGHNARGRHETTPFMTEANATYPAPFGMYARQARKGKQQTGQWWSWSESQPRLLFLTVRDSNVGATRLRYVQHILIQIARDYTLYNWQSIAIAPLGNEYEQHDILQLMHQWLSRVTIPIVMYRSYIPNQFAEEGLI